MPNIYSKSQYANTKWGGAEDHTINDLYDIQNRKRYALKSAYRSKPTAVDRNTQLEHLAQISKYRHGYMP